MRDTWEEGWPVVADIKELVDMLEMCLRDGDASRRIGETESIKKRLEELAKAAIERSGSWRRGEGAEGKKKGDTSALAIKELRHCLAQCERAERLMAEAQIRKPDSPAEKRGGEGERIGCADALRERLEAISLAVSIREARVREGITQADAAARMDISPAYLSRLENATCNPPSARVRRRIEAFLGRKGDGAGGNADTPDGATTEVSARDAEARSAKGAPPGSSGEEGGRPDGDKRAELIRALMKSALELEEGDLEVLVRLAASLSREREPGKAACVGNQMLPEASSGSIARSLRSSRDENQPNG